MSAFPFLAQRLFNVPLAITPQKAEIVTAALAERLGIGSFKRANGTVVPMAIGYEDEGDGSPRSDDRRRGYDLVAGVAVISVRGTLVNRLGSLRPYSGMTGYDGIRSNLMSALADGDVRAILFDLDSPGGEVSGCFDLADTIYAARGLKPLWAVLNDSACSAAFAIASACDRITVPRTGVTGSVGVICMHCDMSRALDKAGLAITLIQYGARKADGADVAPLSAPALTRFQADVDTMGDLFTETVARNLKLPVAKVRDTQAATFLGAAGVRAGFAHAVQAPDAAFRSLLATLH